MRKFLLAAIASGTALMAVAPADAAQGCGDGFHRGQYGHCHPDRGPGYGYRPGPGPGFVAVGAPSVGVFYRGRGYWDGRRYWQHRDRWHNGWRYR